MKKTIKEASVTTVKAGVGKAPKKRPAAKPIADDKTAADEAVAKKGKEIKRVHGSFSMPSSDYALIEQLKSTMKKAGSPVKKNDLLRAGLRALKAIPDEDLKEAIAALKPAKATPRKKGR